MGTIEPVTLSGWYENTDGSVSEIAVTSPGITRTVRTVASWADVPSGEQVAEQRSSDDYERSR